MEKALTPMTAKTTLKAKIRTALNLRKNATVEVKENIDRGNNCKQYSAFLPGSEAGHGYSDIMGFTTYYFPGCCKYGIVSQLYINGKFRGKKLSYHLLNWALAQISMDGYSKAVGTTATSDSDSIMDGILKKAGWKRIDKGVNSNTENTVSMWIKATGLTKRKDTFMSCDS
jgi:hypothetical protein